MKLSKASAVAALCGIALLGGSTAAQAGTVDVADGGVVTSNSAGPNTLRLVSYVGGYPSSRGCSGVRLTPTTYAPLLAGSVPTSSGSAWGAPIGSLALRFYCEAGPGQAYSYWIDCSSTSNLRVTGPTTGGATPGTLALQCGVTYAASGMPTMTTFGGSVPVHYANATSPTTEPSLSIVPSGQTLTVTGPTAPGFTSGGQVVIGAPSGPSGLLNLNMSLVGGVRPVLASS